MKDLNTACREKCETAFEIGIRNCIKPAQKGSKQRKVAISETDSHILYDFYIKHVENNRENAFLAIGRASRKAARKTEFVSIFVFLVALVFVIITIFRSIWPVFAVLLAAGLVIYLLWKRRRTAQKIWASRKAFKRGTEEALEKMCQVMTMSPHRLASLPLVGGWIAAIIVCVYQTIILF